MKIQHFFVRVSTFYNLDVFFNFNTTRCYCTLIVDSGGVMSRLYLIYLEKSSL